MSDRNNRNQRSDDDLEWRIRCIEQDFARSANPPPRRTSLISDASMAYALEIAARAGEHDTLLFSADDPATQEACRRLKADPFHDLLSAVHENDLCGFFITKHLQGDAVKPLHRRWYWTFSDEPGKACFLTLAHVVRHFDMAALLMKENFDFQAEDADGHKPIHYIARYCADPDLIPLLVQNAAVDLLEGCTRTSVYDLPLWQAIQARNGFSMRGLMTVQACGVETGLNERCSVTGTTAAMLAVGLTQNMYESCGEHTKLHAAGLVPADNVARVKAAYRQSLDILGMLASCPDFDPETKDFDGWTARDMIHYTEIAGVYDRALASRTETRPNSTCQPRPGL